MNVLGQTHTMAIIHERKRQERKRISRESETLPCRYSASHGSHKDTMHLREVSRDERRLNRAIDLPGVLYCVGALLNR